ncbi:MAG: hypothetical protein LC808_12460, partial [Actinobacteria bacterium]|nr:hypothetical protein [Actinomycetota bacterium]
FQRFAGEDLEAAHLAHGYAVTVHRSQGATVTRAHALDDGGGRELAYVKMSRARECSTVYAVADDLDQAVEDLGRSWSVSRRIGWAIDWGTPSRGARVGEGVRESDRAVALDHARLLIERDVLRAALPGDPYDARQSTEARVRDLEQRLDALDKVDGTGILRGTPVGEAARALEHAVSEWRRCMAQAKDAGFRERHQLLRQANRAARREEPLREAYERLAEPERERIRAELPRAKKLLAEIEGQRAASTHFGAAYPDALGRRLALEREIEDTGYDMDNYRHDLDGIAPERPAWQQLIRVSDRELPVMERDALVIERGFGPEL